MRQSRVIRVAVFLLSLCIASIAFAQQTGSISGVVTTGGDALPGVTVEAKSNVLPQARVTTTALGGDYRLPALPPGTYTVTYSLSGMATQTRTVQVNLGQESTANAVIGMEGLAESITVTADSSLIDTTSTEIKSAVTDDVIQQIPVGQEYRDLLRLAPGVQVTDAAVRGPSSGGSGQDNVYQFDGVNVTLPLFGTLAADPSSHDIAQVSFIKGGARAIDFNRSAGFTVDSVSKSGTNEWKGEFEYQLQNSSMIADLDRSVTLQAETDRDWITLGLGGPVVREMLFFYGSYYRPTVTRDNGTNAYGAVPKFESTRDEGFGKLTFTPTSNILLNGSYRGSSRTGENASIGSFATASTSTNDVSDQTIGILEASWIISNRSVATFKFNDYALETSSLPSTLFDIDPSTALGTKLNLNALDQSGLFLVPNLISTPGREAYNAFVTPFIQRYGYLNSAGARTGGGAVGGASTIDENDFFRRSFQAGFDITLGSGITHDLHFGVQQYTDEEDLARSSNGFGSISVIGGTANCPTGTACAGQPVFFQTTFQRSTEATAGRQVIHSEFESQSVEINDTIRMKNWSFNLGVMLSNDTLFGQGLREDSSVLSGYVADPGNKYEMYEIPWKKQIQPRLGATWAYNDSDNVYVSYSRYNPAASSLPRAASWDRNTLGLVTEAFFDATGTQIGSRQLASSSGKLFVEDLDPRYTDEYMIGTSQRINNRIAGRAYGRYRYSTNFWEDTNNDARIAFNPPAGIPRELYIPDLAARRAQIGSGSSYVIAELDGAFTKYLEATFEGDWQVTNSTMLRGSYTYSHYYGNFDQDNTSQTFDFATFIGSSNIADGAGRQLWDRKYGNLHENRPHLAKVYGFHSLPWNGTIGAFALYQSGHNWEAWSWEPYQNLTTSRSDTNRYLETAGSRKTESHYQLDMNYTQNIPVAGLNFQILADVFNVTDNQTGYSPQPAIHSATFGQPRLQTPPRRIQLAARIQF